MKLPGNAIGISDTLDYRECPQRMAHGMRRHATLPDGRRDEPPEHTNWTNAYGSAIHDAIHLVETEGLTNEQAVERVWPKWGRYLNPDELQMLKEDMNAYRGDTPLGMELVAAERDVKVPLFVHDGEQIYFRFKIDALYRRIEDHSVFYMRDYKSSKHRKNQKEVDEDPQQWAYNFGVFELFPECMTLLQSYEQLRFGNYLTSKTPEQRESMRQWLIAEVKAILEDDTHEPAKNEWCPYCPLVLDCDVTKRAVRSWRGTLAILAPKTVEGRKVKIAFDEEGESLEELARDLLPGMIETRKHFEAVEKVLRTVIERMPDADREKLGWAMRDRKTRVLSPDGLRVLHEAMGDSFYEAISLSRAALETVVGKPRKNEPLPYPLQVAQEQELEQVSSTTLVRRTT